MKSKVRHDHASGSCTLMVNPTRGEIPDLALAQVLLSGRYADYLLPFTYEGDQQEARFYYDLTGATSLGRVLQHDMTADRFAGVLQVIGDVVRVCAEERAVLQTVLWHQDYLYFAGDDTVPRMIQVPIINGPYFDAGPLSLLFALSKVDTGAFGHPEWSRSVEAFVQTSKEFSADAYLAMLSSILPAGGPRTLPGGDGASASSTGSETRIQEGAGTGSSGTDPTEDYASESRGGDDERYSETVLKLPGEDVVAGVPSGGQAPEPGRKAGEPRNGRSRGFRLPKHGRNPGTALDVPPPPVQDTRSEVEVPGASDDEGPTSLIESRRPRFRVTRIRDGRQVDCSQDTATIGRSAQADIHMGGNTNVSRVHALISCLPGGGFEIKDQHSSNGTRVSGRQLEPGEAALVGPSGVFSLADSDFMVEDLAHEGATGERSGSTSSGQGGGDDGDER